MGGVLDGFEAQAIAVAASAAAPNTPRAYATAYRAFAVFLRACYGDASIDTFTVDAVVAWRDHLQAQGSRRARSRSGCRLVGGSLRRPAPTLLVAQVRCSQVQHERPRALSDRELSGLLARPDLRTTIGIRDRAILDLLARAGL